MRTKGTVLAASLAVGALSGLAYGDACQEVAPLVDVGLATGETGALGAAYLDSQYYASYRGLVAPNHQVAIFDYDGVYQTAFDQHVAAHSSAWGYRDGATDDTLVYFGMEAGVFSHNADGTNPQQIIVGGGPNANYRALAYDPTGDGGNGSFWSCDFGDPIIEVDMAGNLLTTFPNLDEWSIYGLAYDDATGNLWAHSRDPAAASPRFPRIIEISTVTGRWTGVTCETGLDGETQGGMSGVPGGAGYSGHDLDMVCMMQITSDSLKFFATPSFGGILYLDGPGFDPWQAPDPPVYPPPAPPDPVPGYPGDWHTLLPLEEYCTWYDTADFEDVGVGSEGFIGPCDNILLQELDELGNPVGDPEWWHIDDITITVLIELSAGGGQMYIDWMGELDPFPPDTWSGFWSEVYPVPGQQHDVFWTQVDPPAGLLGDFMTLGSDIYVVIEVAVDIIVSQEAPTEGACCVEGECVATTTLEDCTAMGGEWFGGETCPEFQCPQPPTGACCVGSLCAATTTETECDLMAGIWYEGETCPEFDCPVSRIIWAIDHFGTPTDTLITFDALTPTAITTIGPTNVLDGMGGLDFDAEGNLWGHTSFGDGILGLYSINKLTGAATVQGTLNNIGIGDLAFNPVDGQMYGVVFQPVDIYTIDLVTGAATLAGTVTSPAGMAVTGLGCDSSGTLYLQDLATETIYSVSPDLTTATPCHVHPFDANYSQGMTIDWSQGDVGYHGAYNASVSQGQLWAFDIGCTSYVLRGPIGGGDEVGDVACEPAGGIPEDVNGDGCVDVLDLLAVIAAWGNPGGPEDVNGDGIVDVLDLLAVIAAWGTGCP